MDLRMARWCIYALFFFFSSRRRHTRCYRDWSSDVCSSDLVSDPVSPGGLGPWTPYQMLAAGWAGMTAAMLPRRSPLWGIALLGAGWGWVFGALTHLSFLPYALGA